MSKDEKILFIYIFFTGVHMTKQSFRLLLRFIVVFSFPFFCYASGVENDFYKKGLALYESGSFEEATLCFENAAKQDCVPAMEKLGAIYLHDYADVCLCNDEELSKGLTWLNKAAEMESVSAMETLGKVYFTFFSAFTESIKWYVKASDYGSESAMLWLGMLYKSYCEDSASSALWYEKAAEHGELSCYETLGDLYYGDKLENGLQQDYKKSFDWYKKGAELGNAGCLYKLAGFYGIRIEDDTDWVDTGIVSRDDNKAYELYKKAVETKQLDYTSESYALLALGMHWELGLGSSSVNVEKAIEYYSKAVESWHENMNALYCLAKCYDAGITNVQDYEKAAYLYDKCVKASYVKPHPSSSAGKSKYRLAEMYYYGLGVPRSVDKSRSMMEEMLVDYPKNAVDARIFFDEHFLGEHLKSELKAWLKQLHDFGIPSITMFVDNPEGLNVMESSMSNSNVLMLLPDGVAVRVIEVGEMVTIDGVTAPLVKIRIPIYIADVVGKYVGWVFSGHLIEDLPTAWRGISLMNKNGKDFSSVELAAKNGNAKALYKLGEYYKLGLGVQQDYVKAAEYYELAAEKDEPMACFQLACMYMTGLGVEKNEKLVWTKWLPEAKMGGAFWGNDFWDARAKEILAEYIPPHVYVPGYLNEKECFLYGMSLLSSKNSGNEIYYSDISPYFLEAARDGNVDAALFLADLYEQRGLEEKADKWNDEASHLGRSKDDDMHITWLQWLDWLAGNKRSFSDLVEEYMAY